MSLPTPPVNIAARPSFFPVPDFILTQRIYMNADPRHVDIMDFVRQEGIAAICPLPHVVFLGDHTKGKSMILEAITGVKWPDAPALRLRFPVEFICRKDNEATRVSMRPCLETIDERRDMLLTFHMATTGQAPTRRQFREIFSRAARIQEMRTPTPDGGFDEDPMFGEDVLVIQRTAPDLTHLTIIDIPAMFENDFAANVKDSNEVAMSAFLMNTYAGHDENLIIVTFPCELGPLTDRILETLRYYDPKGLRTIVILTKPTKGGEPHLDDFQELGKKHLENLRYGFFYVGEESSFVADCPATRRLRTRVDYYANVGHPLPLPIRSEYGFTALRRWISDVVVHNTTMHYATTVARARGALAHRQRFAGLIGPYRYDIAQQRYYLGEATQTYELTVHHVFINANFTNRYLSAHPYLFITPRLDELNFAYTDVMLRNGHTHQFDERVPHQVETLIAPTQFWVEARTPRDRVYWLTFNVPQETLSPEIRDSLTPPVVCEDPKPEGLLNDIVVKYLYHRDADGYSRIDVEDLCDIFIGQMDKWDGITLAHVSNVILLVHHFTLHALAMACPFGHMRSRLLAYIVPELVRRYKAAVILAEELVDIESTDNLDGLRPHFTAILAVLAHRQTYLDEEFGDAGSPTSPIEPFENPEAELWSTLTKVEQDFCVTVHDLIQAQYSIARTRLLDGIFRLVVGNILFSGEDSALRVLTPAYVGLMSDEEVAATAQETQSTEYSRETVQRDTELLENTLAILEGYQASVIEPFGQAMAGGLGDMTMDDVIG